MTFIFAPLPDRDRRAFLTALGDWSGKPRSTFSRSFPPCNEIANGDDENEILAKVFSAIASDYPHYEATRALTILHSAIDTHTRRYDLLWADAKSTHPGQPTQRTTWKEVKRYEQMLIVLCTWHDAIFDEYVAPAPVPALNTELEPAE